MKNLALTLKAILSIYYTFKATLPGGTTENTQVVGRGCPSLVPPAGNISDGDLGREAGMGQVSQPAAHPGFPAFPRWGIPPHTDTQGASSALQGPHSSRMGWTRVLSLTSVGLRGAKYSGWGKFNPSTLRHTLSSSAPHTQQHQTQMAPRSSQGVVLLLNPLNVQLNQIFIHQYNSGHRHDKVYIIYSEI